MADKMNDIGDWQSPLLASAAVLLDPQPGKTLADQFQHIAKNIGRVAFREDGDEWRAYYAMPESMDGAIFLGSIKMAAVAGVSPRCKHRRNAFMMMMREFVGDMIHKTAGHRPKFRGASPAPINERKI